MCLAITLTTSNNNFCKKQNILKLTIILNFKKQNNQKTIKLLLITAMQRVQSKDIILKKIPLKIQFCVT